LIQISFFLNQDIGSLNVYTRTTYGGRMNKIWSKDFEVGDFWTRANVKLLIGEPFQIVLEAIVGDGYAGDIAIDDTSFTSGCILGNVTLETVTTPAPPTITPNPCQANGQFMCLENRQCIDKVKVCDFKVDCPLPGGSDETECGTCTFDNNNGTLCGWKDHSYGQLDWKLTQGSTNLGPVGDHTTGSGFYMFVPANGGYGFASVRTPTVGPAGIECQLKFWYYMDYDEDVDNSRIAVYIRNEADNFNSFLFIANIYESTGGQWKQVAVNIGHRAGRFSIGM
jgi:hypothetical protein